MSRNQLLHRRLVVAVADDFEGLHQGNTRGEHGGELPAEHRDVFGLDLAAFLEGLALLLDAVYCDALAAQVGTQCGFIGRKTLARDPVALLVHASPAEGLVTLDCLSAAVATAVAMLANP
jgi:hypothetical protein